MLTPFINLDPLMLGQLRAKDCMMWTCLCKLSGAKSNYVLAPLPRFLVSLQISSRSSAFVFVNMYQCLLFR